MSRQRALSFDEFAPPLLRIYGILGPIYLERPSTIATRDSGDRQRKLSRYPVEGVVKKI